MYTYTYVVHGAESFLKSLSGLQIVKKFPAFYGSRRSITALTSARRLSTCPYPELAPSSPHTHSPLPSCFPTNILFPLILSSHLRLGLPSGLFPSSFPTSTLCMPLLSPIRATCPAHLILLDFITRTILGEEYRSLSSSLCSLLHSLVTSSLLNPNILLSTLFSNTLSLRSSLNMSDQSSHPYKTAGEIIVLYILIFIFLDMKPEDKRFCTE